MAGEIDAREARRILRALRGNLREVTKQDPEHEHEHEVRGVAVPAVEAHDLSEDGWG